jgi:hypothetical protein
MSLERTWVDAEIRARLAWEIEKASFQSEDMVPIIDLETALKIIRGTNE